MADQQQKPSGVPLTGSAVFDQELYGGAGDKYAGYVQEIDDEEVVEERAAPKSFGRSTRDELPDEQQDQVCFLCRLCVAIVRPAAWLTSAINAVVFMDNAGRLHTAILVGSGPWRGAKSVAVTPPLLPTARARTVSIASC